MLTYGRSSNGNLAVSHARTRGAWDEVEAIGEFYSIVDYEDLSEDEMDRADALEKLAFMPWKKEVPSKSTGGRDE